MRTLCRVAGHTLGLDEELRRELLILKTRRAWLRWLKHHFWMPEWEYQAQGRPRILEGLCL